MTNEEEALSQRILNLDFDRRGEFADIIELAAHVCDKAVAVITIVDRNTTWVKASSGLVFENVAKEISFSRHTVQQDGVFIISDTASDERFSDSPIMRERPEIRFYAGAPLVFPGGQKLGTLSLIDFKPGTLTDIQQRTLCVLARHVMLLIELELSQRQLQAKVDEVEAKNGALRAIAQMQSHEIRHPLASIMGLVNLVRDGACDADEEWLSNITVVTTILDNKIRAIVNESMGESDAKMLKFNKMVEEIEDYAILLLDRDGNIENWNKGAEKIKGYHSSEIVGKNFRVFYTEDDRQKNLPELLLQKAAESGVSRNEGLRVRKDGTTFMARVVITAIHDNNKIVIGFTKVTRDLTAH